MDETLLTAVLHNDNHALRYILPNPRNKSYCLRPKRQHQLTLALRRDTFLLDFCLKTLDQPICTISFLLCNVLRFVNKIINMVGAGVNRITY